MTMWVPWKEGKAMAITFCSWLAFDLTCSVDFIDSGGKKGAEYLDGWIKCKNFFVVIFIT